MNLHEYFRLCCTLDMKENLYGTFITYDAAGEHTTVTAEGLFSIVQSNRP